MKQRSLPAAISTAVLALLAGLTAATAPAHAADESTTLAAPSYVALGDSYASGTGTRTYISDGTSCQRSVYAYPWLIASARGYTLNFRACSGARIPDVNNQISALTSTTNYVTVSVGGNDAGFADVLTECAYPWWASDCNGAIDDAQSYINNTLPGALSTLYGSIRSRAANAKVVVVGYPRIFMGEDCNAGTWFSPSEQSRLNQTADLLNSKLSAAASARGFSFANPTSRFIGHAVCDDVEWINGLSNPISESYHPNRSGHSAGYSPLVSPLLTGLAAASAGEASLVAPSAAQRAYDARIQPETFQLPDLTTPAARAAARKAGIYDVEAWIARNS
jgi:lysophospholipase L1-like esterase